MLNDFHKTYDVTTPGHVIFNFISQRERLLKLKKMARTALKVLEKILHTVALWGFSAPFRPFHTMNTMYHGVPAIVGRILVTLQSSSKSIHGFCHPVLTSVPPSPLSSLSSSLPDHSELTFPISPTNSNFCLPLLPLPKSTFTSTFYRYSLLAALSRRDHHWLVNLPNFYSRI